MARARQASHNAPAPGQPGGRLTLQTGVPVMSANQISVGTVYYTPYLGDTVPLYNGTEWVNTVFTELTMVMGSNWAANSVYDCYIFNDAGTLRLLTGAAWTSDTARNETLTRVNGLLTNTSTMTGRYSNSATVSVPANRGLYVGSFRTISAGQTEFSFLTASTYRAQLIWNMYNRVPFTAYSYDSTVSWTYTSATVRASNNNTNNRVYVFQGQQEGIYQIATQLRIDAVASGVVFIGWFYDNTNSFTLRELVYAPGGVAVTMQCACVGTHSAGLGFHFYQQTEQSDGSHTYTGFGGSIDHTINVTGMY